MRENDGAVSRVLAALTLVAKLRKEKERNEKGLREDGEKIAKGITSGQLSHDLEWIDGLFVAAARQEVFGYVIHFLTNENLKDKATFESLARYARRQVLRGAIHQKYGISLCRILLDRCRLQAWAEVLDTVEQIEEHGVTM